MDLFWTHTDCVVKLSGTFSVGVCLGERVWEMCVYRLETSILESLLTGIHLGTEQKILLMFEQFTNFAWVYAQFSASSLISV